MPSLKPSLKLFALVILANFLIAGLSAKSPTADIDYAAFLGQHDMIWDRTPHRWEVAPYSGNGNIGFLFYKHKSDGPNAISIHLGRHDYYDHRLPVDGDDHLWIYRGRLPLGRFQITAKGEITSTNLRPHIAINGVPARGDQLSKNPDGSISLPLNKGDHATLSAKPIFDLSKAELTISPIPVSPDQHNLFGFSKKTERLPGHSFYAR